MPTFNFNTGTAGNSLYSFGLLLFNALVRSYKYDFVAVAIYVFSSALILSYSALLILFASFRVVVMIKEDLSEKTCFRVLSSSKSYAVCFPNLILFRIFKKFSFSCLNTFVNSICSIWLVFNSFLKTKDEKKYGVL